jgi:hypothetical protein
MPPDEMHGFVYAGEQIHRDCKAFHGGAASAGENGDDRIQTGLPESYASFRRLERELDDQRVGFDGKPNIADAKKQTPQLCAGQPAALGQG